LFIDETGYRHIPDLIFNKCFSSLKMSLLRCLTIMLLLGSLSLFSQLVMAEKPPINNIPVAVANGESDSGEGKAVADNLDITETPDQFFVDGFEGLSKGMVCSKDAECATGLLCC
jgi:hypothetical protein